MDLLTWIETHQAELLALGAALWTAASIYVRFTPSKRDDEAMSRFRVQVLERLSFLQPRDGAGFFSLPGGKAKRGES